MTCQSLAVFATSSQIPLCGMPKPHMCSMVQCTQLAVVSLTLCDCQTRLCIRVGGHICCPQQWLDALHEASGRLHSIVVEMTGILRGLLL